MLLLARIWNDDALHRGLLFFDLAQLFVLGLAVDAVSVDTVHAAAAERGVDLLLRRFSQLTVDVNVVIWAQALQFVLAILIHVSHNLLLIILANSFVRSKGPWTILNWCLYDVFAEANNLRQVLILLDAQGLARCHR